MLLPILTLDIHEILDHFAAVSIYRTVSKKNLIYLRSY